MAAVSPIVCQATATWRPCARRMAARSSRRRGVTHCAKRTVGIHGQPREEEKMRNVIARFCLGVALLAISCLSATAQAATNDASIARSNAYTQRVLDVEFKHAPEWASQQGLSQFDPLVANPTLADQMTKRREL